MMKKIVRYLWRGQYAFKQCKYAFNNVKFQNRIHKNYEGYKIPYSTGVLRLIWHLNTDLLSLKSVKLAIPQIWRLYFFLLSLHWRQSWRKRFIVSLWFPYPLFPHVSCWLFLDIKCLWVSLVCPIHILLSLNSYCLELLLTLSHSSMCGLI